MPPSRRDRVAPGRRIQCIATSATVGADTDPAVTRFASNLFGEEFDWVDGQPARQDVVTARRVQMNTAPTGDP